MVRRTSGPSPSLGAESDRRLFPREAASLPALLHAGELTLEGRLRDVSEGGAFLATSLLIETGERGLLEAAGLTIAVEVVWLRGNAPPEGPGMGLVFLGSEAERARYKERLLSG